MKAEPSQRPELENAIGGLLLVLSLGFTMVFLLRLPFNLDEVEFARATRFVLDGQVPFRDFFEHHPPLQWILFAPPMGLLARGADLGTFLTMRALQVPLWMGTAWLVWAWGRESGSSRSRVLMVLALLFANAHFAAHVVEYRIDAVMVFFYILGLVLAERGVRNADGWIYVLSGVCWALSCLASQRIVPVVLASTVLYLFVRPEDRWGIHRKGLGIVLGGAATAAASTALLALGGALGAFWNQTVVLNLAYQEHVEGGPSTAFFREWLVAPLERPYFLPFALAWALGLIAIIRCLLRLKRPDRSVRLALLLITQLLSLSAFHPFHPYHFLSLWWLLALLLAGEPAPSVPGAPRMRLPALALVSVVLLLGMAWTYRRTHWPNLQAAREVQAGLIEDLQEVTAEGEAVWEGAGYALNRVPAGRFWFTPSLVVDLTRRGLLPPFTAEDLRAQRPGAILMGPRFASYLDALSPELRQEILRGYLPKTPVVWIPAPNVRLSFQEPVHEGFVLKSGRYRLRLSSTCPESEWFQSPPSFLDLYFHLMSRGRDVVWPRSMAGADADLAVEVDGRPAALSADGDYLLQAGQKFRLVWKGAGEIAVAFLPEPMDSCRLPLPRERGNAPPSHPAS